MSITSAGLVLALNVKGFHEWDPRAKVVVVLIVTVLAVVAFVGAVRKFGWIALLLPAVLIGSLVVMNQNSGCLEHFGDLQPAKPTDR